MFKPEDLQNFNDEVTEWGKKANDALKSSVDSTGIKSHPNSANEVSLKKSLKMKTRLMNGMVGRIGFSMNRSGVFVHKGVSRGHPKSNPREAKEWFNPVIEKNLPDLAGIVAEQTGQMIVNALIIK